MSEEKKNGKMRKKTKDFALRVIRCVRSLPKSDDARIIGNQLLRSGTSVASNYRSACRARSKKDFIYKMGIVEEEADESLLWMELLADSGIVATAKLSSLKDEANEIIAVAVSSIKTARGGSRHKGK